MGNVTPASEDGRPYRFKLNPFATDHLDFVANHPSATKAEKELGAIGFVVLPELSKLLIQIRAVYGQVSVNGQGSYELCLAGLVLIYEHVVLLLAEALLDRSIRRDDTLKSLVDELLGSGLIAQAEFDHLNALRNLRNNAVHNDFKHSQVDMKQRFLAMYKPLMEFLAGRFITGGSAASKLPFLELKQGAYYIRPTFESDAFVKKFWLPRCVEIVAQPATRTES